MERGRESWIFQHFTNISAPTYRTPPSFIMSLTEGGKCNRIYKGRATLFVVVLLDNRPHSFTFSFKGRVQIFITTPSPPPHADKKENQIFLIYREIQSGAVVKSYMRKGFLIYEEMWKYFPIYKEAVSHIWLCNCSTLDFLIYEENLIFFFISVQINKMATIS